MGMPSLIDSKFLRHTKRSHDLSFVRFDDAGKERDRSRDGLLGKEAEDTKHGQSSIVDFCDKSSCLVFFRSVLGELEGVIQIEGDVVRNIVEGWKLSGFTPFCVVRSVSVVA